MTNDEVVAALKLIAEKGKTTGLTAEQVQTLVSYTLIAVEKGQEKERNPKYALSKKGRVMLKANSK